jgi:hypothetical protein
MDIIKECKYDITELEHKGKKIYYTHENMRNLAIIMENPIFIEFFNKNFKTQDDINTIVMLMNTYNYINNLCKYNDTYNNLNIFHKISILSIILKNSKTRRIMVDSYLKMYNKNIDKNMDIKRIE